MLQPMGSQRVGHNSATEQRQTHETDSILQTGKQTQRSQGLPWGLKADETVEHLDPGSLAPKLVLLMIKLFSSHP